VEIVSLGMRLDVQVAHISVCQLRRTFSLSLSLSRNAVSFLILFHFFLLGLPAFKPGEKVEIDFGMDDI